MEAACCLARCRRLSILFVSIPDSGPSRGEDSAASSDRLPPLLAMYSWPTLPVLDADKFLLTRTLLCVGKQKGDGIVVLLPVESVIPDMVDGGTGPKKLNGVRNIDEDGRGGRREGWERPVDWHSCTSSGGRQAAFDMRMSCSHIGEGDRSATPIGRFKSEMKERFKNKSYVVITWASFWRPRIFIGRRLPDSFHVKLACCCPDTLHDELISVNVLQPWMPFRSGARMGACGRGCGVV